MPKEKSKSKWALLFASLAAIIAPQPVAPPPATPPTVVESIITFEQKASEFTGQDYGESVSSSKQDTAITAAVEQEMSLTEQQVIAIQEKDCTTARQEIKDEINSILSNPLAIISLVADITSLATIGYDIVNHVLEKQKEKIRKLHENSPKVSLSSNPYFDEFYQKAMIILEVYKKLKNFRSEIRLTTIEISRETEIPKGELETLLPDLGFTKSGHYWTPPQPIDEVIKQVRALYRQRKLKEFFDLFRIGNLIRVAIVAFEIWIIYNVLQGSYTTTDKIGITIFLVLILLVTVFFAFFVFPLPPVFRR